MDQRILAQQLQHYLTPVLGTVFLYSGLHFAVFFFILTGRFELYQLKIV